MTGLKMRFFVFRKRRFLLCPPSIYHRKRFDSWKQRKRDIRKSLRRKIAINSSERDRIVDRLKPSQSGAGVARDVGGVGAAAA